MKAIAVSSRFLSLVLLFSLSLHAASPVWAAESGSSTPSPTWNERVAQFFQRSEKRADEACKVFLEKTEALPGPARTVVRAVGLTTARLAGWATFATPMTMGLRDHKKVRYILADTTKSDIPITIAGIVFSKIFSGHGQDLLAPLLNTTEFFSDPAANIGFPFLNMFLQPFVTRKVIESARAGLGLNDNYTMVQAGLRNIMVGTWGYAISELLLKGGDINATWFATTLAASTVWSVLNEFNRQWVTQPLFYYFFPNAGVLPTLRQVTNTDEFVAKNNAEIQSIRSRMAELRGELTTRLSQGESSRLTILADDVNIPDGGYRDPRAHELQVEINRARNRIVTLKGSNFWAQKLRHGVANGVLTPEAGFERLEQTRFWSQTAFGVTMLTIYLMTIKSVLIGTPTDPGMMYDLVVSAGGYFSTLISGLQSMTTPTVLEDVVDSMNMMGQISQDFAP